MSKNPPLHAWVIVAVFDDVKAAIALQAFLSSEGFATRIHDERRLQRYWFLVRPHAGIQVQIVEHDYDAVKNVLHIPPGTSLHLQKAIRCPSCNSLRVQYPQMTRNFVLPTVVAQILVFTGAMERENYCEDCHHTWKRSSRRRKPSTKHKHTKAATA